MHFGRTIGEILCAHSKLNIGYSAFILISKLANTRKTMHKWPPRTNSMNCNFAFGNCLIKSIKLRRSKTINGWDSLTGLCP